MKEIKEYAVIECSDVKELKECRKKLLDFGFPEDMEWNEEMIIDHSLKEMMCAIWLSVYSQTFQIHNHDCHEKIQIKYSELETYLNKVYT